MDEWMNGGQTGGQKADGHRQWDNTPDHQGAESGQPESVQPGSVQPGSVLDLHIGTAGMQRQGEDSTKAIPWKQEQIISPSQSEAWQQAMEASQWAARSSRRERESKRRFTAAAMVACMIVGSLCGFAGAFAYDAYKNAGSAGGPPVLYQSVIQNTAALLSGEPAMSTEEAAAAVKLVVVEILIEYTERGRRFGYSVPREGAGSGVVITQDGYIVTNYHVIENANNIMVRLPDGKTHQANVVGSDPESDLAVIKIPATGLTPAVLGDSSTLRVGQSILAVGNPLGELGGTVTAGIISALDRELAVEGQMMSLLQTDAAVNAGNSGGGLFSLYGELVGIVNAKSVDYGVEGLGFAIPINSAKKVIEDLISSGYVKGRVSAGLMVVDVPTAMDAMRYRVSQTGLYINESKDSQLRSGDRIVGVNQDEITDLASFRAALRKYNVGDTVQIIVWRGDERITASIVLTELRPGI